MDIKTILGFMLLFVILVSLLTAFAWLLMRILYFINKKKQIAKFSDIDPSIPSFYVDENYLGNAINLNVGTYDNAAMEAAGLPTNSLSSLKVPSTFSVSLHKMMDPNAHKGLVFSSDVPRLALYNFNDKTKSIIVTKKN